MEELKIDDKKTQKNRKKRSWVWQYFKDLGESTSQCMVNKQCLTSISYKDGTNNMSYHLKHDHQIFERGENEEKPQKLKVEFPKQRELESALYVREINHYIILCVVYLLN